MAAVDPIFGRNHYPLIRIGNPDSRYMSREIMVRSLENRGIDQAAYDNSLAASPTGIGPRLNPGCVPPADPAPSLRPVPVPE